MGVKDFLWNGGVLLSKKSTSPFHIHIVDKDGMILSTTQIDHKLYRTGPLIGKNFKDIIDPLDVHACVDTVKKVINENAHEFIAYSMFRKLSFIALLVPRGDKIFCFELASSPGTDKQVQKNMLLKSARGLLPGFKISVEDEMRMIN